MQITQQMIDQAAKWLRDNDSRSNFWKDWDVLPRSQKKKWLEKAEGALRAAAKE